jgi:hypothetical protein
MDPYDGDYSEAQDYFDTLGIEENPTKEEALRKLLTIYGHYLVGVPELPLDPFLTKANTFLDPQ